MRFEKRFIVFFRFLPLAEQLFQFLRRGDHRCLRRHVTDGQRLSDKRFVKGIKPQGGRLFDFIQAISSRFVFHRQIPFVLSENGKIFGSDRQIRRFAVLGLIRVLGVFGNGRRHFAARLSDFGFGNLGFGF